MNYIILLAFLSTFLTVPVFCQDLNVEFGGQVAFASTFVKMSDSGNKAIKPTFNPSAVLLGVYTKVYSPKWGGFKLGLLRHDWSETICLEGLGCVSTRSTPVDIELELLYHKEIGLKKSRWTITPYLGYAIGIRPTASSTWIPYQSGTNPPIGSAPYMEGEQNSQLENYYHLINFELEGSYKLSDYFKLSPYFKYGQGLTTIVEDRFTYWYDDGSTGDASFTQNGGYWSFGLRLSYVFSWYKNRA